MKKLIVIAAALFALASPAVASAAYGSSFGVVVNHGCSDKVNTYYHTAIIRCGSGNTTVGVRTRDHGIRYTGTTLQRGQVYRVGAYLLVHVRAWQHITILYTR